MSSLLLRDPKLEEASLAAATVASKFKAQQDLVASQTERISQLEANVKRLTAELREREDSSIACSSKEKAEYEGKIKQHLLFIDQLIQDKKELSANCEKLVNKLKQADTTYSTRLKALQDRYKVELTKQKEVGVNTITCLLVFLLALLADLLIWLANLIVLSASSVSRYRKPPRS
jgi:chromosome segregation ATPase